MKEEWKDIKEYEGIYEVSNFGKVRSLKFGKVKIRNGYKDSNGYLQIDLWNKGKKRMFLIHRLVAQAFLNNPNNYEEVNHMDKNIENNSVYNLEYCNRIYNVRYGNRTKKINQYDLQGNFIKEWASSKDIERQLHFPSSTIKACCNGKFKTSHNYIWKYKDIV